MSADRANRPADEAAATVQAVIDRVSEAVVVDREVLEALLAAVFARGHVLIEDVPGTGKTVTARLLTEALGLEFSRLQFTPDLLPADVTGSTVYREATGTFEFSPGPVFANVVLADEINRAPPKTQAALLEAMEERQVSHDGDTHALPQPFVVIATQNPVEQEGTFPLPEAQRDRFSVKTSLGYPDDEGELELLDRRAARETLAPSVDAVVDATDVRELQARTETVSVDTKVREYIIALARATREDDRTELGVSPRGIQRVFEVARARALFDGREYVTPDDVKRLAPATMSHRLVLTTDATVEGVTKREVVRDVLSDVPVPAVAPTDGPTPEPPDSYTPGDRASGSDHAGARDGEADAFSFEGESGPDEQ